MRSRPRSYRTRPLAPALASAALAEVGGAGISHPQPQASLQRFTHASLGSIRPLGTGWRLSQRGGPGSLLACAITATVWIRLQRRDESHGLLTFQVPPCSSFHGISPAVAWIGAAPKWVTPGPS